VSLLLNFGVRCQKHDPAVLIGVLSIASELMDELPLLSLTAAKSGFTTEMNACLMPLFSYLQSQQATAGPHASLLVFLSRHMFVGRGRGRGSREMLIQDTIVCARVYAQLIFFLLLFLFLRFILTVLFSLP
jgi:hypothetical protein